MLYVKFETVNETRVAVAATTKYDEVGLRDGSLENRNDWKSFQRVMEIASQLSRATGKVYLAVDSGRNVSPRFDVIEAPVLGEKVSRYFNGDSYPAGEIVKMSKSLRRVETSDGSVFWRRASSGTWLCGGTWGMRSGHHYEQNPSF